MTPADWAGLRLPPGIELRPAADGASDFAERLYLGSMRPLLQQLDAWDEREMVAHFRAGFAPGQVRVISSEGVDVGYLQVVDGDEALTILQIHLLAAARGRGLGSAIIRSLLAHAGARGKDVLLSVVRHNPAIALYHRLGFEVVAEDPIRLHMRWRSPAARVSSAPIPPERPASQPRAPRQGPAR